MSEERGTEILELLQARNRISVSELVERFGVSEVTARKDLARLEERGQAVRTRGGAVLARAVVVARPIDARRDERTEAKAAIARMAAELIVEGSTLFIDSGTTASALAMLLRGRRLRVVTHSMLAIDSLDDDDEVTVYSLGGMYNREARSFVGPSTTQNLDRYALDFSFIGASSLTPNGTCSAQNELEADIKRHAMSVSRRRILIVDSSKLNMSAFAVFARAADYHTLITDSDISAEIAESLRSAGIELLIAAYEAVCD